MINVGIVRDLSIPSVRAIHNQKIIIHIKLIKEKHSCIRGKTTNKNNN